MRVGPNLALVTGHGTELLLERRRDVHPRIRDEAARVAPFGAAGGVEGVPRLDEGLERPRGHERGAEQELVVAVRTPAKLAIDHRRPHLADGALERGDEIEQGQRVEPLVWKAQPARLL